MKKNTRTLLIAAIGVLIVALIVGPKLSLFDSGPAPAATVANTDRRLPVSIHVVRAEVVEDRIRSTGTVLANEEVELRSEIAGKVDRILFREGSQVQKGDLLVTINDAELQAALQRLRSQEQLAREIESRRRALFESGLISSEEYERAVNELNTTRADIELTKVRIEKMQIRAPFDGVVGLRHVSEGSYVSSATRIASLQNLSSVKIDFSIPERYANDVRPGQRIQFRLTGMEGTYSGEIYAVEPKIDPATRTVLLRARSLNPDRRILPGAFAEIELTLRRIDNALMVPTESLVPELGGQRVYLVKNGEAQPHRVEVGIRRERMVQITSGLRAQDTVVTSGILQLRPGLPVRVVE